MDSRPRRHLEIERKYEVMTDTPAPSFADSGLDVSTPETVELRATYYDTASFALATHRIAVRHRTGGSDAGWHVKQRTADGVAETEWPETHAMPDALIATLTELTGITVAGLRPVGRIDTTRTTRRVTRDGVPCAEFVDDSVSAHDLARDVARAWREWEVELIRDGPEGTEAAASTDEALLDRIETILIDAGAVPSFAESKISRTMGTLMQAAERRGARAEELAALAVIDVADRLAARAPHGGEARDVQADPRVSSLRAIARRLNSEA